MTITALPTPPSRSDPANFAARGDAFLGALPTFATEVNAEASAINADASAAAASATAAAASQIAAASSAAAALNSANSAASASGASAWVSGTTYALGAVVYSTVSGRTYRRIVAGAGTTDPSADTTNWRVLVLDMDTGYPTTRPSLLLDFARSETLDSRITFTRASSATYYDGKAFVKADENLLLWSQEFNDAIWTKTSASVTANSDTAPNGTATADTITASGANATCTQSRLTVTSTYTFSVWLRRKTGTGNVDITCGGGTWVTQTITSTWARYTVTQALSAGSRTPGIRLVVSGDEVYAWGAQLENRSSATAYNNASTTTTQPVSTYLPQLITAAANVARIDHAPTTGESLGLLVEEQRANLALQSAALGTSPWIFAGGGVAITANTAIAPDGTLSADTLTEGTSNTRQYTQQSATIAANTQHTFSVYVKAGSRNFAGIAFGKASTPFTRGGFIINLTTGAKTADYNSGTPTSIIRHAAVDCGGGWWRVAVTVLIDATSTDGYFEVWPSSDGTASTYTGASGSILVWGAQLEAGPFPTSYIATTTTQVTRNADEASITGANFSAWFRHDQGTLLAAAKANAAATMPIEQALVEANDGTNQNRHVLYRSFDFFAVGQTTVRTVNQAQVASVSVWAARATAALAYAYRQNDFAASFNGADAVVDSNGVLPEVNQLRIGYTTDVGRSLNGHIQRITYWPTRLTNAQLQAITTQ